jgi:hypothetical protein
VIDRLGHPEPFVPEGIALGERAQLSMTHDEADTGAHGGRDEVTEALAAPHTLEGRPRLFEAVDRPMIIGMELVGSTKVEVRQRVQNNFPAGRGEGEGTLGAGDGLVMRTPVAEME